MTTDGGVDVATYKRYSMPNAYLDEAVVTRRMMTSLPVWNSRTAPLSEVLRSHSTPVVVRDTSRRNDKRRDIYVHSVSSSSVLVADGLSADSRGRLVSTGRRYLIPVDHSGWFELLSQDGHAAAPVTSVQQLMKLTAHRCLVRKTITGISAGDVNARHPCKIAAGEIISTEGVVTSPNSHSQCLRCRIARTGQSVLLAADQTGVFSPVAGPTSVAGVHRMRSVVAKFRLPVVVRLITRSTETSNNSANVTFRVVAIQTEPAAYVVPLWLVRSPSDVGRRSVLSLSVTAQASSVLDGVLSTSEKSTTDKWKDADWTELERRCERLIKSGGVTVELMRMFPTQNVDDRQRTAPVTPSVEPSHPSSGDSNWRLLHEIDHIYEAIKAGHKNDVKKTTTTTRQLPRRYRSVTVRHDVAATAAFNGGPVKTRSPARRSYTLDPSFMKPLPTQTHHHGTSDIFYKHSPQQPDNTHQTSPVRLSYKTSSLKHRSSQQVQQLHNEQQQHNNEPVYEELHCPTHAKSEIADSGQYVVLTDSSADNLRQVIKHNSTEPTLTQSQSHHPGSVERPRRWSVATGPSHSVVSCQMQVFDDLTNDSVTVPEVPATPPRPDTSFAAGKSNVYFDTGTLPHSTGSGRSPSDDVTATDRNLSSVRGTVSNTLKRALCRHIPGSKTTAADVNPRLTASTAAVHADDATVTSQSRDVLALEYAGGKVTHF